MTAQKDRISRQLTALGAAWAVTKDKCVLPDDGFGAMPSYHIHPDQSHSHQNDIVRFYYLADLEQWIRETRQAQQEHAERLARECENYMLRSLTELSVLTGVNRETLYKAAQSGRLDAEQSGTIWLATLADVKMFKARYIPRPR